MSKRVNVNPGQYKVAGRLRPDETAAARREQRTGGGRKASGGIVGGRPERVEGKQQAPPRGGAPVPPAGRQGRGRK